MRESSRHQQWCRFLASGRLETVPLAEAAFDPERVAQVRTANARLHVPGLQAHAQACATGAFVSPMHLFSTGGSNVHHCPFCNYEIGNKSHLWWYCRVTNPTRRRCGGALCGVYNARTVRPMSVGEFMNGCLTSLWIKVRRPPATWWETCWDGSYHLQLESGMLTWGQEWSKYVRTSMRSKGCTSTCLFAGSLSLHRGDGAQA